jgi:hypothetical protein
MRSKRQMKSSGRLGRVGENNKHDKDSSMSDREGISTQPEPIRGDKGAPIIGPTNQAREAESPSRLAPPEPDHGTLPSLRLSFADCHNWFAARRVGAADDGTRATDRAGAQLCQHAA